MTTLTIRIDEDLKKEASEIFLRNGMNLTTGITILLKQTVLKNKFPCSIDYEISSDYSFTYPDKFFELFSSNSESEIEIPEELSFENDDEIRI